MCDMHCMLGEAAVRGVLKLTEIVILWIQYTVPFGFSLLRHFLVIAFQLLNYFVWLRISDDGYMPEIGHIVHNVN